MSDSEDDVRPPEPRWLGVVFAGSTAACAMGLGFAGPPGMLASVASFGTLAIVAALALVRARIAAFVGLIVSVPVVTFLMVGAVLLGLSGIGQPDCNTNCQAAAAADEAALHDVAHAITALLVTSITSAIVLVVTRRRRR